MYSPEKVQQAAEKIIAALGERQLKEKSIHQYRLHYQEFSTYIEASCEDILPAENFRDWNENSDLMSFLNSLC